MRRPNLSRSVVISGASSGIGEASAHAFARRGACLVLAARDEQALEAVAGACVGLGAGAVVIVPTDVTDAEQVRRLAERARLEHGRIDIWFSNVGVGAVGAFHETPMAAHEQVVRANLIGHMNDAHAALPIFLRQGHGIFINMISLGAFVPTPYAAAYTASKYGLKGFSEALRGELAPYPRIHVCDVYPAFIDTPGLAHGANYTGRAITAPPPVYDARRVARAVVRLAERPRPTTVVGSFAHLTRFGHGLAPETLTWLLGALIRAYFQRARLEPISDGNLFAPPPAPGGIDGGLRRPMPSSGKVMLGALLAGGLVMLALGACAARR